MPQAGHGVGETGGEGRLGPDDDEVDPVDPGDGGDRPDVERRHPFDRRPEGGEPGVAGEGDELGDPGAPGERPAEGVLPTAGADEEDPHPSVLRDELAAFRPHRDPSDGDPGELLDPLEVRLRLGGQLVIGSAPGDV